jgi:hypothetical protein
MSPYAIHEEAMKKQGSVSIMRPQEAVPTVLAPNFGGTMGGGLPVRQIPTYKFPLIVYMHPNEPTQEIEHRNDKFEVVGTEVVQTEHLTRSIACAAHAATGAEKCDACEKVLKLALSEGWVEEPYIPEPLPNRNVGLYGKKPQAKQV